MTGTLEKMKSIRDWFAAMDQTAGVVRGTTHGIFGPTGVDEAFALCERLGLREGMRFCDLGSGDGRVALVAAMLCESVGIEGDPALHAVAELAKGDLLRCVPELARCTLRNEDYTEADLSCFDVLFAFADHAWPEGVERALLSRERSGLLVAHQDIFRPKLLRKGPTVWIGQSPFVTSPLGASPAGGACGG